MSIDFAEIFSKEGTVNIMRAQNNFSASALISSLTWLIITTIILIASLIVYFISVLDENAAEDVHKRVEVAFNVEKESLLTLNVEYSFWDESYQSTVVNRDQKWIDKTYKNYLLPAYNLSYVAAIEKDLTVHMLADSKLHGPSSERSILDSSLLERLMATHRGSRTLQRAPFFTKQDDRVFLVSVEPFRDEKSENTIDGSHLVLAKALTQKYLNEISKKFQLPELRYTTNKVEHDSLSLDGYGAVGGVGYVYWESPRVTNIVTPYLVVILASLLIVIVSLARLILNKNFRDTTKYQEKLLKAAMTDPLTRAANRSFFMETGEKEFLLQSQQQNHLSVLIFDLDHFKAVNDHYGHSAGDEALKHFTRICQNAVRGTDLFGRLGGEEFALILPGAGPVKGEELAERIRASLNGSPLVINGQMIDLTVSVGVATLEHQSTFKELMLDADKALYFAKNSGRNVVKSFG